MAAIDDGELAADRLESYRALQRDVQRLRTKHDTLARYESHKKERTFGRLVREATALKKR